MTTRTLTAMFNTREEARRAADALLKDTTLGHPMVEVLPAEGTAGDGRTGSATSGAASPTARPQEDQGFFASLRNMFIPDEDSHAYVEGLRRGGVLVVAKIEEANAQRAMDVLEREGAVDFDQQEAAWREEGWTGYQGAGAMGGAGLTGSAMTDAEAAATTTPASNAMRSAGMTTGTAGAMRGTEATATGTGTTATGTTGVGMTGREERIPIVEERLRVGKREVSGGRVRVRSYIVETPVQEQVTLRDETVSVERRPVDRPLSAADAEAFRERTIEASTTHEEAVVSKEARVKEELVLNKQASERTETVSDKVRETRVEVEDGRNNALTGGKTTGAATTGTGTVNPAGSGRSGTRGEGI